MIQNAHIGTLFKSAAIACLVLSHVSCVEENELASLQPITKSDVVTFGINMSNQWEPDVIGNDESASTGGSAYTRSATLPMDCDSDMPEGGIYMYMVEEDIPSGVDTAQVKSRTANLPDIGIFAVNTLLDGTKEDFMTNISLSGYGQTGGTPQQYWPGYGTLKFYAYTPYVELQDDSYLSFDNENHRPKFNYTVPTNVEDQIDLTDGESAEYNGDPFSSETASSEVSIDLIHALSQVQVKVGNIPDGGEVTSIEFTNIYHTGTKVLGGDWTVTTEGADAKAAYKQPYEEAATLTKNNENVLGEPFYMMPQTLTDNAEIKVNLNITSTKPETGETRYKDYPLSKELNEFGASWAPDKKYTYVITTPEEVEVKVDDEVNGNIKSGLKIQNTGLADAYIRVAIFGSWVVKKGDDKVFFAVWSEEEDGKFEWGATGTKPTTTATTSTNWRLGSDGYYYYMKMVTRDEKLEPLFDTYTLTANAPTVDAYLELSIMAQAVSEEDYELVWPKDIIDALPSQN